jgi:hypothetical protein
VAVLVEQSLSHTGHIGLTAKCTANIPPVERLLLEGGDTRIALGPDGITNNYGCRPFPDSTLLAFGSSTASTISDAGFAAARGLHERIANTFGATRSAEIYAHELNRIRRELLRLCGVSDLHGLDAIFAASGTDLHLISAQLACAVEAQPLLVIMMGAEETGRGVPAAMAGRHFGHCTSQGKNVTQGMLLDGGALIETASVPIRSSNGMPRAAAEIDAEVEALVTQAVAAGRGVLLTLIDVSKTGLISPSPACAAALRRVWPEHVDVLVDACQFRISSSTLRAYLEQGFMVALTGSKFLTGPTFSGVLLVPYAVAQHARKRPLPVSLSAYSSALDWPEGWRAADSLDAAPNFGLLLRWEAALEELKMFRAVPEHDVARFLREFAHAMQTRLKNDPRFEPLLVPALDRHPVAATTTWDHIPTIFPFLLCRNGSDGIQRPLTENETGMVHRLLRTSLCDLSGANHDAGGNEIAALRCQLGQPVACGMRDGMPLSALRVCASSRLIVEAVSHGSGDAIIKQALDALDKASALAAMSPSDLFALFNRLA